MAVQVDDSEEQAPGDALEAVLAQLSVAPSCEEEELLYLEERKEQLLQSNESLVTARIKNQVQLSVIFETSLLVGDITLLNTHSPAYCIICLPYCCDP